uniref:Uncharacterized protein n=1 Tax=Melanopsichium pennsylvanicum 4 TaxID=1398559 RepID=A0A077QSE1_9BASI|nr:uncharacterized protein BN887_06067 [Melanopsichium pennsylvanicum 4]
MGAPHFGSKEPSHRTSADLAVKVGERPNLGKGPPLNSKKGSEKAIMCLSSQVVVAELHGNMERNTDTLAERPRSDLTITSATIGEGVMINASRNQLCALME